VLTYLGRRLATSMVTLLGFCTLVFFTASALMPGDFTCNFGRCSAELGEALGLDRPLWQQYLSFIGALLTLNLGTSTGGTPIGPAMLGVLPWTLLVFMVAVGTAFAAGVGLGRVAGWSGRPWLRGAIRFTSVTTHSLFPPFLTFVVAFGFVQSFGLGAWSRLQNLDVGTTNLSGLPRNPIPVPDYGATPWLVMVSMLGAVALTALVAGTVRRYRRHRLPTSMATATFLALLWAVWSVLGLTTAALDILLWMAPAILVVTIIAFGEIVLVVDASMHGTASEDYVRTARAKGLAEVDVRNRHASRLAILPAISRFVVSLPFVLTGLVIIEFAFTTPIHHNATILYPGISRLVFAAIDVRDFPLVVGGLLLIGVVGVLARLVLDVVHALLDPRVRLAGRGVAR
jgi:peptide/nickel transport system permease protein